VGLNEYNRKRNFGITSEPAGDAPVARRADGQLGFVIQKHAATRLHYDFRLELDGVLLSWSVPKGPSLDPQVKRLAMHVEDHPIAYADFEGIIPKGQYGGGTVLLWDRGTWEPVGDPRANYAKGNLKFHLRGEKLHGGFALVKLGGPRKPEERGWLLIKERDAEAREGPAAEITELLPDSVATGRTMDDIAAQRSRVWHSKGVEVHIGAVEGAKKVAMAKLLPSLRPPQAAKRATPPKGDGWLHEFAIDGERLLVAIDGDDVRLLSAQGKPLAKAAAAKHAALANATRLLPSKSVIVDGVVVPDSEGSAAVGYFVFDMPYLDGQELRATPLARRKALLEDLVKRTAAGTPVRYLDHVAGDGGAFRTEAARLGITAMQSRPAASKYGARAGWLRIAI
jgi:bifunctional non-homologous end joining protein LigD